MTAWKEFSVTINNEAAEAVTSIFTELGSAGVSVTDRNDFLKLPEYGHDTLWELNESDFPKDGVLIKGYFTEFDNISEIESALKNKIEKLTDYGLSTSGFTLKVTDVKEEEWATAWKKYYHPVPITRFMTIVPQWEEYESQFQDERVCYLDPGLAFGTGTHPTTQLCIQALEATVRKTHTVFDVGTGSGVLSIVSALYGANKVKAFDLDEVAVKSAQDNMALNKLDQAIAVEANNLLEGVQESADIIVANILAEIIIPFVPDAYAHLNEEGLFICSGIIESKKDEVIKTLKQNNFEITQVNQMKDWVAIVSKKQKEDVQK